ncbi:MAG: hypothetical protein ACLRVS_04630 [Lachnospiraceae bacterium]
MRLVQLIGATDAAGAVCRGVVIGLVGSPPITFLYFIYKQVVQFETLDDRLFLLPAGKFLACCFRLAC